MTDPNARKSDQPPLPFASSYPMPVDQLALEAELIDEFRIKFPNSQPILEEALAELGRFTGSGTPKYQISEPQRKAAMEAGYADEEGFVDGKQSSFAFSKLVLKMPINRKDEEWKELTGQEREIARRTDDGMRIIGEMPPETYTLLEGIYRLVGAEVLRDDRAEGETQGQVVRQGQYHGLPVYLVGGI